MGQYKIAVIIGSFRKESLNRQLASAVAKLASRGFTFNQVQIDDLPFYNQDDEANPADSIKRFRAELKSVNGLLFVTPEYNRSIPGVLKNALDQGSRPAGQSVWAGKPAGILGVSSGAIGTAVAQTHLRTILAHLDVPTLSQPEVLIHFRDGLFDEQGEIGLGSRQFLQTWMDRYVAWVKRFALMP
jgi:chromate reductase